MIFAIGKGGEMMCAPPYTPPRAFTLIELIVVMTLLVVAISIALPTLANFFRGRTLDSEARRLLALTRQGQSRAVSEGVPMVLRVDAAQGKYALDEDSSYTDHDPKRIQFSLDRDLHMEVVAAATPITMLSSRTPSRANPSNLPEIRFLPDGTIDETSVQAVRLLGRDGVSLWLGQSRNRLNYEIRNQAN